MVNGQASLDGGAQHLADRCDPVLGQDIDQAVYFVPGGHAASVPRPLTLPREALWNGSLTPGDLPPSPRALTVPVVTLITTGQLAAELGVSRSAVLKWHRARLITPELITPGNHLRWDAERVREQLRARRQRDE